MRTMTGRPVSSERMKAWRMARKESETVVGSRIGSSAANPRARLSCSFWEPQLPGSSPSRMTKPAWQPDRLIVMRGSRAMLSPTLLTHRSERLPASEAPKAISRATFSLLVHSTRTSSGEVWSKMLLTTYVAGEPG